MCNGAIPTTKSIEDALRALGWSPLTVQFSDVYRVWSHPGTMRTIRVPRTSVLTPAVAARILRNAARGDLR